MTIHDTNSVVDINLVTAINRLEIRNNLVRSNARMGH